MIGEAVTAMAHKLGIQVIAKGIEYQAQMDALAQVKCDHAQGFRISGVLGADAFEKMFHSPPDLTRQPPAFSS